LLRAFFQEWLAEQRSASVHTIRSYRDTWRLLLRFVAERKAPGLRGSCWLTSRPSEVRAFLHHTEHGAQGHDRHTQLPARRDPQLLQLRGGQRSRIFAQCAEVLTVPLKREPTAAPCYLEPEEVEAILAQPDRSTLEGMRDHVLLSFLYNSGARIQEALDLCSNAVRFDAPHYVASMARGARSASVRSGQKP
jgi:site-specific recombinase XerD